VLTPSQQQVVSVGLLGIGLYFGVQLVRGIVGYLRYRGVARSALVTWPTPRPAHLRWLTGLGVLAAVLAAVLARQHKPVHHGVALGLMSVYFLGMVPVARRIRMGLYGDGIWAHRGLLRWENVARIAFVERPQVVLLLQARRGGASFKLPVPADEYGAVRKLLEEKARAGVLRLEPAILGLDRG
jgi:hypothetical protein